jgi:hypothetical protein
VWGWLNFLHLCDIAVILTCAGFWRSSPLLISSQALSAIVPVLFWDVDFFGRLLLGHHPIGGTEYMWDSSFPLTVRLLSLFHVVWPVLLLWALRKLGYDRRALRFQSGIALVVLIASRFVSADLNLNFAYRDPFLKTSLGPGIVHLTVTAGALIGVAYWPVHFLLAKCFSPDVRKLEPALRS